MPLRDVLSKISIIHFTQMFWRRSMPCDFNSTYQIAVTQPTANIAYLSTSVDSRCGYFPIQSYVSSRYLKSDVLATTTV